MTETEKWQHEVDADEIAEKLEEQETDFIMNRLSRTERENTKYEFYEEFIEECDPNELIINIDGIIDIIGQKWAWNNRLAEGKENIFNDIGFNWVGHQKFSGWDCRYNKINEKDFNRKTIYYMDLTMAKAMAIKYSANSIVMTERGFSLRWGCIANRNPSERGNFGCGKYEKSKALCGATGMGLWINNNINLDKMKQHAEDGAVISPALIKHVVNNCGYNDDEKQRFINGEKIAERELWAKGGVYQHKKSADYKLWIAGAKILLKINKKGDERLVKQAKKDIKKMKAEEYEEELKAKRVEREAETLRNKKIREWREKTEEPEKPKKKKIIKQKKKIVKDEEPKKKKLKKLIVKRATTPVLE